MAISPLPQRAFGKSLTGHFWAQNVLQFNHFKVTGQFHFSIFQTPSHDNETTFRSLNLYLLRGILLLPVSFL
jgi:hypothetical protein